MIMSKTLIEVNYRANNIIKMATIPIKEDFTEADIEAYLKSTGEEVDSIIDYEEYEEVEESGNAPCDNTGMCIGTGCHYYFTVCHPKGAM